MNNDVESFLNSKAIAIVGVSKNEKSFSYNLLKAFVRRGFKIYPVNPNENEIAGLKCYNSVLAMPNDVDAVYIIKRKDLALDIAREVANKGIKKIWIHVKCDSPQVNDLSKEFGVTIIAGECFFMWAEPTGIHRFHRFLRGLFDKSVK
jgi:uncharacterized protein